MMKRYTYAAVSDPNKEAVGIVVAHNHENAIQMAAERKRLDVESFMTLYIINEVEVKKPKK